MIGDIDFILCPDLWQSEGSSAPGLVSVTYHQAERGSTDLKCHGRHQDLGLLERSADHTGFAITYNNVIVKSVCSALPSNNSELILGHRGVNLLNDQDSLK
jgi:hypothetical protein